MKALRFAIISLAFVSRAGFGSDEPIEKFTILTSDYARRIVVEHFDLVFDLEKINPDVLALFETKVERKHIANRGEPFNATDVVTQDLPARRFVMAGSAPRLWFILYEHGGIAYHHNLIVFAKNGQWKIAAALQGNIKEDLNLQSLKHAVKKGRFFSVADHPDF